MPYILKTKADEYDFGNLFEKATASKGELNYAITVLLIQYILKRGESYSVISDAVSAANDAAEEMRRRILNEYEDSKIFSAAAMDPYNMLGRYPREERAGEKTNSAK